MKQSRRRVVITGVGVVNPAVRGDGAALGAWLARPRGAALTGKGGGVARLDPGNLAGVIDPTEARRLSRVCQLTIAAARLALAESGYDPARGLGLVLGTEFGDLTSTIEFADGYLQRGPTGLSALLFPNTVMNAMVATCAIAVGAREMALTLNAPSVAGELAVARGAAAVAAGRVPAVLAGGVDEIAPLVECALDELGASAQVRGEGATLLLLETAESAAARGAAPLGEITAAAWRALRARPHGVGRTGVSEAISAALSGASAAATDVRWVYGSASGDDARDAWERRLLDTALAPSRPPVTSLATLLGHHAGTGALGVAAAAWTARSGLWPVTAGDGARVPPGRGLVHGVARGGGHVALVVDAA